MPDVTGQGDAPRVDSRPAAVPVAGYIYCLAPACEHEIEPTYRDRRGQVYIVSERGNRIYPERPIKIKCPQCGTWRSWKPGVKDEPKPLPIDRRPNSAILNSATGK
jgi:hypothetical protein